MAARIDEVLLLPIEHIQIARPIATLRSESGYIMRFMEGMMPINELMAMLGGTQVNQPQFQQMTPTNIQPTPIMQGAQLQGQQAQNTYQQQMGASNNMMGGIASLGSSALMMF